MSQWPKLSDIAMRVQTGEMSAVGNAKMALDTIAANKDFDAIITTLDNAIAHAQLIDDKVARGEKAGRLAGVPFIAKDNFLSGPTTAASNMLKNFEAPYRATAIAKLEEEGAVLIAKANLDAFAHGSSTENSDFFVTKNPHDKTRVPGGSSGGSVTAVMLDMAPFALGTDTGGSIRLPASFTGAVGLKPTYGLVSRSGVVAMASSTDVVGPITKNVEDAALVVDVMSGPDGLDSTMVERDKAAYTDLTTSLAGKKIGVVKEYMEDGMEPGVRSVIESAIEKLRSAGADISTVSLPSLPLALACYYVVCPAEVSSNLSRYDGQRYGHSAKEAKGLQQSYELSREEGFGAEAKRRIMIGTYVLSSGYYDAYYKKAQTVRTKIIDEFKQAYEQYDFLVGPTAPMTAFKIGERSHDPLKMYLTDIVTVAANMAGIPAISIPAGRAEGLPIGLQILAPFGADRALLGAAKGFEELV